MTKFPKILASAALAMAIGVSGFAAGGTTAAAAEFCHHGYCRHVRHVRHRNHRHHRARWRHDHRGWYWNNRYWHNGDTWHGRYFYNGNWYRHRRHFCRHHYCGYTYYGPALNFGITF